MTLLGLAAEERDMSLSEISRDAALAAIVTDQSVAPAPTVAAVVIMLRALVSDAKAEYSATSKVFTKAEHALFVEWLDRLAEGPFAGLMSSLKLVS